METGSSVMFSVMLGSGQVVETGSSVMLGSGRVPGCGNRQQCHVGIQAVETGSCVMLGYRLWKQAAVLCGNRQQCDVGIQAVETGSCVMWKQAAVLCGNRQQCYVETGSSVMLGSGRVPGCYPVVCDRALRCDLTCVHHQQRVNGDLIVMKLIVFVFFFFFEF